MKKIWSFLKELDPIKLTLDFFTVIILISFIIEFFSRRQIPVMILMAASYKIALPACAGYREINRWWPYTAQENDSLAWVKRSKLIQGEYYVFAWMTISVILMFLEVIMPDYFQAKPEHLLGLTEWVIGIFLATSGSKKFQQVRALAKTNLASNPTDGTTSP